MDEQNVLSAVREIVREEIAQNNKVLDAKFEGIEQRFEVLENRMAALETESRQTRVLIENGYNRIENLLLEAYAPLVERVKKVDDYAEVKNTVAEHDYAIQNHNVRLSSLETTK